MTTSDTITIGEFVAHDSRTAAVFTKYGIDFCCRGYRTFADVCQSKNIDPDLLLEELSMVMMIENLPNINFQSWPMDLIVDYIDKKYHRPATRNIPALQQFLHNICKLQGDAHPELFAIQKLFNECAVTLTKRMQDKEKYLFPYLSKMEISGNIDFLEQPFYFIESQVALMVNEHECEGNKFRRISFLSNRYTPPACASGTYRATYAMLHDFEKDFYDQIHIENNILYPKAKRMERQLIDAAQIIGIPA